MPFCFWDELAFEVVEATPSSLAVKWAEAVGALLLRLGRFQNEDGMTLCEVGHFDETAARRETRSSVGTARRTIPTRACDNQRRKCFKPFPEGPEQHVVPWRTCCQAWRAASVATDNFHSEIETKSRFISDPRFPASGNSHRICELRLCIGCRRPFVPGAAQEKT